MVSHPNQIPLKLGYNSCLPGFAVASTTLTRSRLPRRSSSVLTASIRPTSTFVSSSLVYMPIAMCFSLLEIPRSAGVLNSVGVRFRYASRISSPIPGFHTYSSPTSRSSLPSTLQIFLLSSPFHIVPTSSSVLSTCDVHPDSGALLVPAALHVES